ncbi:MAG: hypothetical protein M3R45_05340 [Pseudomonadota bacterium]|nr:hypothetical protein [Pseudomonadota bacterium]
MSIFNWFSRQPAQAKSAPADEHNRSLPSQKKGSAPAPQEPEGDQRSERSKLRHLRRDQVFVAIREAMTRTGVLSSNYKFKVFSEDQQGNEFVVMMNLVTIAGEPLPPFGEMEAMIIDSAKVRFEIVVSAVYWRLTEVAAAVKFVPPAVAQRAAAQPAQPPKAKSPYETIEADEVVAFQQALLAASAQGHSMPPERSSAGPRRQRPARVKDFEDTEMSESTTSPVLSKTQYGDLI